MRCDTRMGGTFNSKSMDKFQLSSLLSEGLICRATSCSNVYHVGLLQPSAIDQQRSHRQGSPAPIQHHAKDWGTRGERSFLNGFACSAKPHQSLWFVFLEALPVHTRVVGVPWQKSTRPQHVVSQVLSSDPLGMVTLPSSS